MTKRPVSDGKAEILPPGATRVDESALHFSDLAPDMTLGVALRERLRYWGVRRTLDTYRAVVESGLDLTQSLRALYEAKRELEQEKERLENIETYRVGAAREAAAFLREVEARYDIADRNAEIAKRDAIQAKIDTKLFERRLADIEVLALIESNERAAELAKSQRELEEAQGGATGSSYRERRRELQQRRKDYEVLMADKQADIEKYGGEDKLPHWLQTFYDNLEDELGMDGQ